MSDGTGGTGGTDGTGAADAADGPDAADEGHHLRNRADEPAPKLWLFLQADRWLVTGGLLVVVLLVLLAVAYGYPGGRVAARSADSVDTLFQALVTATITGVTLVLTLNQLVLSQELGAAGDQRERMEGALSFREDVADLIDAPVTPAEPSAFVRALVGAIDDRARALRPAVGADPDTASAVDELVAGIAADADRVAPRLEDAQFGEFQVVSAALDFDYSRHLFAARRVAARGDEPVPVEGAAVLEELIDLLAAFGVAREHFKTLYFQWTLIDLSRDILWAALPALVVPACMVVFFDPTAVVLRVGGVDLLPVLVAAAVTVATLPFLLLLAYVLRIATVTKYTLSIGPFVLRSTDRTEDVELES